MKLTGATSLARLTTPETIALVLSPLLLLAFLLVLNFPNHLRHPSLLRLGGFARGAPAHTPDELRIFIGVVTFADRHEVRHLHRLIRSLQPTPVAATIDLKFVFCHLTRDDQRVLVALEILRYDDIMIVDCELENVNNGKTYAFLSAVARAFKGTGTGGRPPYDYVMKTDDDTYLRLPELVAALRPLPRNDLYFGYMVPQDYFHPGDPMFMAGMGYALSWDMVEWIGVSSMTRNNTIGEEDKLVGRWLRASGKGKNVYDTKPSDAQISEWVHGRDRILEPGKAAQYDLPRPPRRFLPRTISVHRLKDHAKWAQALKYFNATAGFRPSKSCNFTV